MAQVYDLLRDTWLKATPEEVVRQKWIEVMLNHLSFPKELIVIEKKISQLPHVYGSVNEFPERRIDLLAYTQLKGKIMPLLIVEFKSIPLTQKALLQVQGYNQFINAPYLAIANEKNILVGSFHEDQEYEAIDFLPSYPLLKKKLGATLL